MPNLVIIALLLAGGMTGCASKVSYEYGNFVVPSALAGVNETINQTLVADTVKQLIELYPPASTRFDFAQPTPDVYGTRLVQSLRLNGYALSEFVAAPGVNGPNQEVTVSASPGLRLRYVIDAPSGLDLYRVTLMIGTQSLSRAYVAHDKTISPAGAWARKE